MHSFLEALTRGGPGGLPRPIELHAHDPTRYVGDMLAWIHQAMAGEHEFLSSLFEVKDDKRMVGSIRVPRKGVEEAYVRDLMDTDLEKLCMPLKVTCPGLKEGRSCLTVTIGSGPPDGKIPRGEHYVL